MSQQEHIHAAFEWVLKVYAESKALLQDSLELLDGCGFRPVKDTLFSAYDTTVHLKDDLHPFVYLLGNFVRRESAHKNGLFVFVDFHSSRHQGPRLLLGTWKSARPQKLNHWTINATARLPGFRDRCTFEKQGVVTVHQPTDTGRKDGTTSMLGEIKHLEVPLTALQSREQLQELIDALVKFHEGEEDDLRRQVEALR